MKNNTFIARLSRGAVASTIAGGFLAPQDHSVFFGMPAGEYREAFAEPTIFPEEVGQTGTGASVVVNFSQTPEEWTNKMQREFRALALAEANGTLSDAQATRLEQLSFWRDIFSNPRTTEEVLLQLKRDRLLEKISETLKQYVEFQEGTIKKRAAAR